MDRRKEIGKEIKEWEQKLLLPDCDFESQTWIELQIAELKKERKKIGSDAKWQKELAEYRRSFPL